MQTVACARIDPAYGGRRTATCRLDALSAQGQISDREWAAGHRLRRKWLAAQALPQASPERAALVDEVDAALLQFLVARSSAPWCAAFTVSVWDSSVSGFYSELRDGLALLANIWQIPGDYRRERATDTF